jgi:hypothetical protein
METPKVYLSFDYQNNEKEKERFVEQSENSSVEFIVEYESSEPTLPPVQWDNVTADKINYSNMLIVLVGKKTAEAAHVVREIALADSQNIPIFGVYVDGTGPSTDLPKGLIGERVVDFDWNAIAAMVEKAMKEGKNQLLWA